MPALIGIVIVLLVGTWIWGKIEDAYHATIGKVTNGDSLSLILLFAFCAFVLVCLCINMFGRRKTAGTDGTPNNRPQSAAGGIQKLPQNAILGRYTDGVVDNLAIGAGGKDSVRIPLHISYLGGSGIPTDRNIDVLSYTLGWTPKHVVVPLYLTAFCHLRNTQRTFRADRILDAYDPETGEEIQDLCAYLDEKAPLCPREPKYAGDDIELPNNRRREPSRDTILIPTSPCNLVVEYEDQNGPETSVGTVESFTYVVNQRVTVVIDINIRRASDQKTQIVKYRQVTSATDPASGGAIPSLGEWLWSHRIR
ncbi:hypothetical protein LV564_05105 [Komagataeibacter nataicola]|uniref:WYL domain-containing protein n=1 Tax=Komagataeibacter nataicola TaxID=265960 RepID=UPI0023DD4C9C|nr:hypothetical protein [Komagataeibacter nataicola]WEQ56466.1 hypothetical protein LV564_05105 [Komagataeibacter nataicola]